MKQKILEILNTYGMEMVLKSSVGAIKFHGFFQLIFGFGLGRTGRS